MIRVNREYSPYGGPADDYIMHSDLYYLFLFLSSLEKEIAKSCCCHLAKQNQEVGDREMIGKSTF